MGPEAEAEANKTMDGFVIRTSMNPKVQPCPAGGRFGGCYLEIDEPSFDDLAGDIGREVMLTRRYRWRRYLWRLPINWMLRVLWWWDQYAVEDWFVDQLDDMDRETQRSVYEWAIEHDSPVNPER